MSTLFLKKPPKERNRNGGLGGESTRRDVESCPLLQFPFLKPKRLGENIDPLKTSPSLSQEKYFGNGPERVYKKLSLL